MKTTILTLAVLLTGCSKKEKQYAFQPSQAQPQPSISYGIYYEVALGSNILTGSWTHHDKENGCNYTLTVNHLNVDAESKIKELERAVSDLSNRLNQVNQPRFKPGIYDGFGNFMHEIDIVPVAPDSGLQYVQGVAITNKP